MNAFEKVKMMESQLFYMYLIKKISREVKEFTLGILDGMN